MMRGRTRGSKEAIRVLMVGAGKITVDQHIPAVNANPAFALAGIVSPRTRLPETRNFSDLATGLRLSDANAVAINTPPQVRFDLAHQAIVAGKHVMLEKPPCMTIAELDDLKMVAEQTGVTLFTGWHSQHAPGVDRARAWLMGKDIDHIDVQWCENVRQWHPGQTWIWQPGGLGVFDPGINALSILSAILDAPLRFDRAQFDIPENCQTPIAANLHGSVGVAGTLDIRLDFHQTGEQTWSITIACEGETLKLQMGGASLSIGGVAVDVGPSREYPAMYARFAQLISGGTSHVDAKPLSWVADAFLIAEHRHVEPFIDDVPHPVAGANQASPSAVSPSDGERVESRTRP